jgi:hypothetical protein
MPSHYEVTINYVDQLLAENKFEDRTDLDTKIVSDTIGV